MSSPARRGSRVIVSCAQWRAHPGNIVAESLFENPEFFWRRTLGHERAEGIHRFGLTIVGKAKSSIVNCGARAGSEDAACTERLTR
jgi:hypothetical protein